MARTERSGPVQQIHRTEAGQKPAAPQSWEPAPVQFEYSDRWSPETFTEPVMRAYAAYERQGHIEIVKVRIGPQTGRAEVLYRGDMPQAWIHEDLSRLKARYCEQERLCARIDAAMAGLADYSNKELDEIMRLYNLAWDNYDSGDRSAMDAALDDMDAYARAIRGRNT